LRHESIHSFLNTSEKKEEEILPYKARFWRVQSGSLMKRRNDREGRGIQLIEMLYQEGENEKGELT
jgi:hypothetical protein